MTENAIFEKSQVSFRISRGILQNYSLGESEMAVNPTANENARLPYQFLYPFKNSEKMNFENEKQETD